MDRRNAAKDAVAHIQGDGAAPGRPQRRGFIVHIRNDAKQVADIKRAGLLGDIGAGEMMIEK
jgi:hypothetical protein